MFVEMSAGAPQHLIDSCFDWKRFLFWDEGKRGVNQDPGLYNEHISVQTDSIPKACQKSKIRKRAGPK